MESRWKSRSSVGRTAREIEGKPVSIPKYGEMREECLNTASENGFIQDKELKLLIFLDWNSSTG